jgi:hypothetical protein
MTTFVLPSEVFPVSMLTTGHGIAAGIGKLGAFLGVFLVPQLPEPAQRSLEDMHEQPGSSPNTNPIQVGGVYEGVQGDFPLIVQESATIHAATPVTDQAG